jgi:tRNA-binding protein
MPNTMPLTWEDFEKVEIRVGTVLEVHNFPMARKPAYQFTVDFGPFGKRCSSAQVTALYTPEELLHKQVVAVTNFPPKQIANFWSECLILGVVGPAGEVVLIRPERNVPNGLRIS